MWKKSRNVLDRGAVGVDVGVVVVSVSYWDCSFCPERKYLSRSSKSTFPLKATAEWEPFCLLIVCIVFAMFFSWCSLILFMIRRLFLFDCCCVLQLCTTCLGDYILFPHLDALNLARKWIYGHCWKTGNWGCLVDSIAALFDQRGIRRFRSIGLPIQVRHYYSHNLTACSIE